MSKLIRISCDPEKKLSRFSIDKFVNLQGALKIMTKENFGKLRARILEKGVRHPPHVWMHDGLPHIIDGHGRTAVLKHLVEEEGYECPPIPAVAVEAASLEEAREEVLAASSNYNTMTNEGLFSFMKTSGMDLLDLDRFVLSEINFPEFKLDFFKDHTLRLGDGKKTTVTFDIDAYKNAEIKQVSLYFQKDNYEKVMSKLAVLLERWSLEDHSQVVWRLLSESV